MQDGVAELERWLLDLIQQGLSSVGSQGHAFWDSFAAKMQDAKLGGIARRIRRFNYIQELGDNWHEQLLEQMAQLYLFVQGFKQLEDLSEPLQEEILALAGLNKKREEVLALEGVKDDWLVVGVSESEEEKLFLRKSYLLGSDSGRIALIMDYNYGVPKFEFNWPLGSGAFCGNRVLSGSISIKKLS